MKIFKKMRHYYRDMKPGVKAAFWFTFCSFFQQGIALLTTPLFTRIMSTEEYGVWTVYMTWKSILTIVVMLNLAGGGFGKAMLLFKSDRDGYVSSLVGLSFCLLVIWGTILIVGNKLFSSVLNLRLDYLIIMLLTLFFQQVFSVWAGAERFDFRYKRILFLTMTSSILSSIISLFAVLFFNYDRVTARIYANESVFCAIYLFLALYVLIKGKCIYKKEYWKFSLIFGISLVPHYLASTILNSSDRIMISRMCNNSQAAMYSIAYTVANIVIILLSSIMSAFSPWMITRVDEKNFDGVKDICNTMSYLFALLAMVPVLVGPEVISLLGSSEYQYAIWILPPVSSSVYFLYLHNLYSCLQFYYEKKVYIVTASVVCAAFNLILNYIFINGYGFIAAGYTTLACYVFLFALDFCFYKRICRENGIDINIYDNKRLTIIAFLVVGFSIVGNILYVFLSLRLLVLGICIALGIYFRKSLFQMVKILRK